MAHSPHTHLEQRRILIIEDNIDAAETLRQLIELSGGREIAVEHDGEAGIAKAVSYAPDLVFCDLGLPRRDGYEVARTLRRNPAFEECLLVALSGYGLPEDVERAYEAGFDLHLTKPVSMKSIEDVLVNGDADALRPAQAAAH